MLPCTCSSGDSQVPGAAAEPAAAEPAAQPAAATAAIPADLPVRRAVRDIRRPAQHLRRVRSDAQCCAERASVWAATDLVAFA